MRQRVHRARPTRRGNPWPRRALVLCLPVSACAAGCDRDGSDVATSVTVTPTTVQSPTTTRAFAAPFVGHVTARDTLGPVVVSQVSYTIDAKRIRREKTDHSDVVTKHLARTSPRAGVIVDLTRDRAILYSTYLDRRVAVELTLAEYDQHMKTVREARSPGDGFGRAFLPLQGRTDLRTSNAPAATSVDGVPCDVLRIESGESAFDVHHAPGMVVDRGLLDRVEPGVPPQVIGFPLRVYTLQAMPATQLASAPSRVEQLAAKALRATTRAAAAVQVNLDAVAIDVTVPDAGAFDVPEGFERCKDLSDFIRRSQPSGGGLDFD